MSNAEDPMALRLAMSTFQYIESTTPEPKTRPTPTVEELAQSYLDREEEDWTFSDPEDIKRLARAVLSK